MDCCQNFSRRIPIPSKLFYPSLDSYPQLAKQVVLDQLAADAAGIRPIEVVLADEASQLRYYQADQAMRHPLENPRCAIRRDLCSGLPARPISEPDWFRWAQKFSCGAPGLWSMVVAKWGLGAREHLGGVEELNDQQAASLMVRSIVLEQLDILSYSCTVMPHAETIEMRQWLFDGATAAHSWLTQGILCRMFDPFITIQALLVLTDEFDAKGKVTQ